MYGKWNMAGDHPAFTKHGHSFNRFGGRRGFHPGFGFRRPKYNVPVNIAETENSFDVYVYATGFDKENIKVAVTDGLLHISGTRTIDESNQPNFVSQEYPVKSFERIVRLNEEVDTTAIKAKQENGVLIITLPKTAEAKKPAQEVNID